MTTLINNSLAAFGRTADQDGAGQAVVAEFRAVTSIAKGQLVAVTVSNHVLTVAAATSATDNVVGVAQESVTGSSGRPVPVKVVVLGPAQAQTADANIEVGDWVSATTAGRYAKAVTAAISDANAKAVGFVLEKTAAADDDAGDLKWIYVSPSLIAVT